MTVRARYVVIVAVLALGLVAGVIVRVVGRTEEAGPVTTAADAATTYPMECVRGCEAAGGCLLSPDDCLARCASDPVIRRCVTVAGTTSCAATASCLMEQFCGTQVPSGTGTCWDALSCARSCTEIDCVCRCAVVAHPRHTLALARAGQCVVNCNFDETCAKARCLASLQACAMQ